MGILRWLAVALLAGALRPALARWTLSTGIIAPDAPISCNPYNFTDFNFNPQLSKASCRRKRGPCPARAMSRGLPRANIPQPASAAGPWASSQVCWAFACK